MIPVRGVSPIKAATGRLTPKKKPLIENDQRPLPKR